MFSILPIIYSLKLVIEGAKPIRLLSISNIKYEFFKAHSPIIVTSSYDCCKFKIQFYLFPNVLQF